MNNKKKIIAICVCVALLAGTILSGTIAYFTDNEAITNTFTSGNVMIDLDEYTDDGPDDGTDLDLIDPNNNIFNKATFKLFPADVYTKKPVITVGKGDQSSENAYVAAIIKITAGDLTKATVADADMPRDDVFNPNLVDADGLLNYEQLLTGGVIDTENTKLKTVTTPSALKDALAANDDSYDYVIYQTAPAVADGGTYTLYVFAKDAMEDGEYIDLFTTLSVPDYWDNAEMDEFEDFSIAVEAYAVQEKNLDDCYVAMTSAFENAFAAVEVVNP